jgi:outer membrane protein assembly factor BamB
MSAQEPRLAPGRDGSLYVSISNRKGPAELLLLDSSGRPRPGWPVAIKDSTRCGVPFPVDDGSVRIVCDARDIPGSDPEADDVSAFAFDADGRLMTGWPVRLKLPAAIAMGTELTVVTEHRINDAEDTTISHDVVVSHIAANGTVRDGTPLALDVNRFGDQWTVGPDGVAFSAGEIDGDTETSRISAIDSTGLRPGWPVTVRGFGSGPAVGSSGQIAVTLGSAERHTSRVVVFDGEGKATSSAVLPFATLERTGDTGGCTASLPQSPIVARTGAIFVYSELDNRIYALDPSLAVHKGWPFEPASSLARATPGLETEHEAGYCPASVTPAAGPDGTLVLSLEAPSSKVGGSLVAVGMDGRVRPGWPVGLKRPGSEFWTVAVGSDGTTYALAVEPEAGGKSSESILAIAPDSTVIYSKTIIDP